jgi:hypothetical protein
MPKNSANKVYLASRFSSILNDVKDSLEGILNPEQPSIPQPPTVDSYCFNYVFSNTAVTQTLTATGSWSGSGINYFTLTHGYVWSNGTSWYWTSALTGGTTYATMNNGGKTNPSNYGFFWKTASGQTNTMISSLKGECPPALSPTPTPSIAASPAASPGVTPTPTPSPSA